MKQHDDATAFMIRLIIKDLKCETSDEQIQMVIDAIAELARIAVEEMAWIREQRRLLQREGAMPSNN